MVFLQLLLMLLLILVAAEVFTNALEHLGERLGISEGVTGSIFAAVGTALPETLVPLLAIFSYTSASGDSQAGHDIGVGAILGAPLMLGTLSISLMALSVLKRRGAHGHIRPERTGLVRDLNFFILAFIFAAAAMFIPHEEALVRYGIGIVMILTYFIYVLMTIQASKALVEDGHATEAEEVMMLAKLGLPTNMTTILLQLGLGLGLLIVGAKGFINEVETAAAILGISALLLSLLIIPIATELPEKVNSILWIRKGKDTLAFGNITGAMVFQGTLLPAIGIMLTEWTPRQEVALGIVVTLLAALWVRYRIAKGGLLVWHLLVNGLFYLVYLAIVLS
ncbi:sodium:calcium antiporter [Methylophilus aquaticus]|uniref:Sodium:calcium antiporter n=1 Tax=Methylophilus aquaticus TaxID=1971610 RepID=A0ABT9JPV9_9PROT|nr:sodium:calcium antiporter [Methylophilus aquaticus]MDP8566514.1 sodium:calcium antiporter [Methylophilus aquaticus]